MRTTLILVSLLGMATTIGCGESSKFGNGNTYAPKSASKEKARQERTSSADATRRDNSGSHEVQSVEDLEPWTAPAAEIVTAPAGQAPTASQDSAPTPVVAEQAEPVAPAEEPVAGSDQAAPKGPSVGDQVSDATSDMVQQTLEGRGTELTAAQTASLTASLTTMANQAAAGDVNVMDLVKDVIDAAKDIKAQNLALAKGASVRALGGVDALAGIDLNAAVNAAALADVLAAAQDLVAAALDLDVAGIVDALQDILAAVLDLVGL